MRIAVDVSIQENALVTGVERVQRSLLEALAAVDEENEYLLVSKRELDLGLPLSDRFRRVAAVKDGPTYLWRERVVPSLLTRERIDVFHSPVSATPVLGKARKIATVHELPWVERDAQVPHGEVVRRGHRVWLFLNVRYASRIVAVSNRTRDNILSLYPDAGEKIEVIHHGVDPRFRRLDDPPARGEFLARLGVPDRPFVLFVGTLRRKKNLRALVEVFSELPEAMRETHALVLAGVRTPAWPELEERIEAHGLAGRVFLPGYVSDDDLVTLYNLADALVYPSLFEGFGLPPLEAMACGTPVVASSGGAIPEVVGRAALTFPPGDRGALRGALERVLGEPDVAADLARKGRRHARRFTWEKTAERYLALYRELAEE